MVPSKVILESVLPVFVLTYNPSSVKFHLALSVSGGPIVLNDPENNEVLETFAPSGLESKTSAVPEEFQGGTKFLPPSVILLACLMSVIGSPVYSAM